MKQRIISAIVLVLLFAAVVIFDTTFKPALNIAVAIIAMLAIYEINKALNHEKSKWLLLLPSMAIAGVVPFCQTDMQLLLAYFLYSLIFFATLMKNHAIITFRDVGVVYSMAMLIPLALKTLVDIRDLSPNHGMFHTLLAILAAWSADVGAYFAGTFLGRHKLCPQISPKKTVEGLVGGTVLDVLVMLLCGWLLGLYYNGTVQVNYWVLALAGALASGISVLGDLSFSLIKRSCHIKDFGQVIPGHGGILDRFDSVIFVAPFMYLFTSFFSLVTH